MTASDAARTEAGLWVELVEMVDRVLAIAPGIDPKPLERQVTGFDPEVDLDRRARRWSHTPVSADLAELARFAAGLAVAESDAWARDDAVVATRALEDRRFLLSDRIVHWAVPWSDGAGRCHLGVREEAHRLRDALLELGDRMRPAPLLTGGEGLNPPGEDAFGPTDPSIPLDRLLRSLHSGAVIFAATAGSLVRRTHPRRFEETELRDPALREDLRTFYSNAAGRWRSLAGDHPGTARLWHDLAVRADSTAIRLGAE